jgi:hypothetical protein
MPHIPEVAALLSAIHALEAIEAIKRAAAKMTPPHAITFPAVS